MAIDIDTLTFAFSAGPLARSLFEQVLKNRSIRFAALFDRVKGTNPQVNRESAELALSNLKGANLIGELKVSDIADFNTFYITSDGLEFGRKAGL